MQGGRWAAVTSSGMGTGLQNALEALVDDELDDRRDDAVAGDVEGGLLELAQQQLVEEGKV